MKVLPLSIAIVLILTVSSAWAAPWKEGGDDVVEDAPTETRANEYDDDLTEDGPDVDTASLDRSSDDELAEDDSESAPDKRSSDEELTEDNSDTVDAVLDTRSSDDAHEPFDDETANEPFDDETANEPFDDETADEPFDDEDANDVEVSANEDDTVPS